MRLTKLAVHAGMLLCDVPTPALVLDHSSALGIRGLSASGIEAALNHEVTCVASSLSDLLYVHATVRSGRESTSAVGLVSTDQEQHPVLAQLDCTLDECGGERSYVGLGLNNHFTGGYYWGRASGPGAAMPAPGVELRSEPGAPFVRVERIDNSNDGKRSEWCEYLRKDDQLQIVPGSISSVLCVYDVLVGVRRVGKGVRPGAEPVVDAAWKRSSDSGWQRFL
jgi:hypothetical protein